MAAITQFINNHRDTVESANCGTESVPPEPVAPQ